MTEQSPDTAAEHTEDDVEQSVDEVSAELAAPESTGHPAVDEVLRSLERLDDQPVSEHVAVFEQAHETLRRTLSDAGDARD
jgi:hypothetical protein